MIPKYIVETFIKKTEVLRSGSCLEFFSKTRDVFDNRLASYAHSTENWLFSAVIGEIGANTFDHNFSFYSDSPRGVYCDFYSDDNYVYICDFGQGLTASLAHTIQSISDDLTAIEIAFTQHVSGRAPEMRGNGLKFVISSVMSNGWHLFFQSGTATCNASGEGYMFSISDYRYDGCLCILSTI